MHEVTQHVLRSVRMCAAHAGKHVLGWKLNHGYRGGPRKLVLAAVAAAPAAPAPLEVTPRASTWVFAWSLLELLNATAIARRTSSTSPCPSASTTMVGSSGCKSERQARCVVVVNHTPNYLNNIHVI